MVTFPKASAVRQPSQRHSDGPVELHGTLARVASCRCPSLKIRQKDKDRVSHRAQVDVLVRARLGGGKLFLFVCCNNTIYVRLFIAKAMRPQLLRSYSLSCLRTVRLSPTMLPKIRDVFSNLPHAKAQGRIRICNILQRQTQKRTPGPGCFTRALRRKLHAGTAYLGGNKLLRPREPTSVQECACSKT